MFSIKFSVIIPLYNKGSVVSQTVLSVLDQGYKNVEVIIVNDGSTDNGVEIVKGILDQRISLISTPNRGVSSARNTGVKKATGDWLMFLDADDTLKPNSLDYYIEVLKKERDLDVIITDFAFNKKSYKGLRDLDTGYLKFPMKLVWERKILPRAGNFVVKNSSLTKIGCFDTNFSQFEDLLFVQELSKLDKWYYINKISLNYIVENNELSNYNPTRLKSNFLLTRSVLQLKNIFLILFAAEMKFYRCKNVAIYHSKESIILINLFKVTGLFLISKLLRVLINK